MATLRAGGGGASHLGAVLDPVGDKCCAGIVFAILWKEGTLSLLQIGALMTREVMLCGFAALLLFRGEFGSYRVRAIWTGKALTILQGIIVLLLILQQPVPAFAYIICFLLGLMAFVELLSRDSPLPSKV